MPPTRNPSRVSVCNRVCGPVCAEKSHKWFISCATPHCQLRNVGSRPTRKDNPRKMSPMQQLRTRSGTSRSVILAARAEALAAAGRCHCVHEDSAQVAQAGPR